MQAEIDAIGKTQLAYADIRSLTYVSHVLSEVMRLYPPVWHLGSQNLSDDQLGDYPLPAGSHVRISPLVIHRNAKYWDNPNTFNPDRFEKEPEPFTFIPFGSGPRLCAGRNFAMMEMVLILAGILQQFTISSANEKDLEIAPLMTLRPDGDVRVRVVGR